MGVVMNNNTGGIASKQASANPHRLPTGGRFLFFDIINYLL
jgi:hypothetical protein|tara:strand:- start:514 stop:636 length:123 start_codon:yes stop_codon:yes gene_type:complete